MRDLILVLCEACEAKLPPRHDRAPLVVRCPLCGARNRVLKLLRRRRGSGTQYRRDERPIHVNERTP